jgi:hypothetical protein
LYKYANDLDVSVKNQVYSIIKLFSEFIISSNAPKIKLITKESADFSKIDGEIIPGGNQVLLGLKFKIPNHDLIMKLYRISLPELIMHCLSIDEYYNRSSSLTQKFIGIDIQTRIMNVFGIGVITIKDTKYCYLIQEFNHYKPYYELVHENYTLTIQLNKLFTEIAKKQKMIF